jgi:hypothetical protein
LTQCSPSQASLKYCGFSMMWPWSPEPLPSVGERELPPNVMKCRDMASPSSGASTAGPEKEIHGGSQSPGTHLDPCSQLPPCRVPGHSHLLTCRGKTEELGSKTAGRRKGRQRGLSLTGSCPTPGFMATKNPPTPNRAQTSQTHLVFDYNPATN